jgi:hypothetical protein
MSPRARLVTALDDAIDALQKADDLGDEDAVWVEIQNVLDCLYRFEEQEKRSNGLAYYRKRGASTSGQTVGALIWVRGLLLRHDAEFRLRLFKPFAIAGEDNALQPLAYKIIPGRQPVLVDDVHWPERRHLPAPGRRYKPHQRDTYYDALVAGQPLMEPLRAAARYFTDGR